MLNIARFSPFDDAFDHLLRGFVVRPVALEANANDAAVKFRADITETEKAYTVHAELPGVKKEDIQISIDGDQVAISAETRTEKDVKEGERLVVFIDLVAGQFTPQDFGEDIVGVVGHGTVRSLALRHSRTGEWASTP